MDDLGHDFAAGGGIDAFDDQTGLKATDLVRAGSTASEVDLDGKKEALGNYKLAPYGVGDSWSVAAWVRPVKLPKKAKKPVYIFDLNGARSKKNVNRISLTLDSAGHFGRAERRPGPRARDHVVSRREPGSARHARGTTWSR